MVAKDFKNIADEVHQPPRCRRTEMTVRIEIEATNQTGFGDSKVRTVSENAKTDTFDQSCDKEI